MIVGIISGTKLHIYKLVNPHKEDNTRRINETSVGDRVSLEHRLSCVYLFTSGSKSPGDYSLIERVEAWLEHFEDENREHYYIRIDP